MADNYLYKNEHTDPSLGAMAVGPSIMRAGSAVKSFLFPNGIMGKKAGYIKLPFGKELGEGLTGNGWEFDPKKDLDLRGTGKTYKNALDEAFKRTGVPRDKFKVIKWAKDQTGKSIPVEWEGPNGANVNMDIPEWNNVLSDGSLGKGPHQPHIGYQNTGKGTNRIRGHIFVDNVPTTRR